jgi:hypothetical protein
VSVSAVWSGGDGIHSVQVVISFVVGLGHRESERPSSREQEVPAKARLPKRRRGEACGPGRMGASDVPQARLEGEGTTATCQVAVRRLGIAAREPLRRQSSGSEHLVRPSGDRPGCRLLRSPSTEGLPICEGTARGGSGSAKFARLVRSVAALRWPADCSKGGHGNGERVRSPGLAI